MKFPKLKLKTPVIRSLIRLYLVFGTMIILFVIVFNTNFFYWNCNVPFTAFIAYGSGFLIRLFGGDALVESTYLLTSGFRINIVDGCNGLYAAAILVSGVAAYPSKAKQKIIGVLLGFTAIFGMNLIRVISLFYLGQYFPEIFEEAHIYIWQPLIILWAIFVWFIWWIKIEK